MKRLLGASILVSTTLFAIQLHAAADKIRIISGTLVQAPETSPGALGVNGTSGLSIDATLDSTVASLFWWSDCNRVPICQPGHVLSIRSAYGTSPPIFTGSGQITVAGRTYSLWTPDGATADFEFDGAVVLPELTGTFGTVQVFAPFAFRGSLQVPNRRDPATDDVFDLYGSGVATITLRPHPSSLIWLGL